MSPFSLAGIIIVQTALICYSIAIISEQRKRMITKGIVTFLALGVLLDITATTFMILGSSLGGSLPTSPEHCWLPWHREISKLTRFTDSFHPDRIEQAK